MCGRFGLTVTEKIAARFGLESHQLSFDARYNAAPTQFMPVVVADGSRVAQMMGWGYEPRWLRDKGGGRPLINARAEKLYSAPTFREALLHRRAIVPATHFFEWAGSGRDKVPHVFCLKDCELFGFAGLWFAEGGEHRFVIITTEPNELTRPVHNRMPAILRREHEEEWLDPDQGDSDRLTALLGPYPAHEMEAYPVSSRVSSATNDSADLLERVS